MKQKDKVEKLLIDHNDVFADIINVVVYDELVVKEDELHSTKTESIYKAMTGDYNAQFRDVAKIYVMTREHREMTLFRQSNRSGM